jgi:hypothetical protein
VFDTTRVGEAIHGERASTDGLCDCTEAIERTIPDAFVGRVLFPTLSAALASYEIDTITTF